MSASGTTSDAPCSSTSARRAAMYPGSSTSGTIARWSAAKSAGASSFASTATVVAPAAPNAVTMSTRCPAQVKRTTATSLSLVTRVQEERKLGEDAEREQPEDDRPGAPAQPVERVAEA